MALHAGTLYLKIVAGGTPVQVSTVCVPGSSRLGYGKWAQSIQFQAHPSNAGIVYIGLAGMVTSTGLNVLAVLPKPVSATTGPFASELFSEMLAPNGLSLDELYIDGTTNDLALISFTQQ